MTTRRPSDPYIEALAQANATIQRTTEAIHEFLDVWTSAAVKTAEEHFQEETSDD